MNRLLISHWFRPSLVFAGLVVAGCGPQVGAGEAEASATESATATDGGTDTAQSGCPNDSQDRTGYCFERVDLPYEQTRPFAGDFLGDGLAAIALFHQPRSADDGNLSVFRWTGSMTPVATNEWTSTSGFELTARIDGDRDEVIRVNGNRLYRYRVEGGGIQSLEVEVWPGPSMEGIRPLIAFDTDLDGIDEIISFDHPRARSLDLQYAPVIVVRRTSEGWVIDRDLPLQPFYGTATAADVTGDGQLELLIGEQRTNKRAEAYDPSRDNVVVFRPTLQGLVEIGRAPLGNQHITISTGDLDGDGLLDILVPRSVPRELFEEEYDEEPRPIAVLRNLGNAVFENPVLLDHTDVRGPLETIDLDGDGRDEIVFGVSPSNSVEDRHVVVLEDPLAGSMPARLVDDWVSYLLVGDFDHDGVDDLAFNGPDGLHLLFLIR